MEKGRGVVRVVTMVMSNKRRPSGRRDNLVASVRKAVSMDTFVRQYMNLIQQPDSTGHHLHVDDNEAVCLWHAPRC